MCTDSTKSSYTHTKMTPPHNYRFFYENMDLLSSEFWHFFDAVVTFAISSLHKYKPNIGNFLIEITWDKLQTTSDRADGGGKWDISGKIKKENWSFDFRSFLCLKKRNMLIDPILCCLSEAHWNRQCAFQHPQPPGVLSIIANATSGHCGVLFDIKRCSSSWKYTQDFRSWIKTTLCVIPWARRCFNCKFRKQMKTAPDVFAKRNTVYPAKVGKGCYWWQE